MKPLFQRIKEQLFKGSEHVSKENFFDGGTVPKSDPIYHNNTSEKAAQKPVIRRKNK